MSAILREWRERVAAKDPLPVRGRVREVVGFSCRASGIQASIGTLCSVETKERKVLMEVTGFQEGEALLMPLSEMEGVASGQLVVPEPRAHLVPVGRGLLGRVVNALGEPIDGKGPLEAESYVELYHAPPQPLSRKLIREMLPLGVRVLDAMVPVGRGQRMGIFSGSGVGKSTLLGMVARYAKSAVNVIALVGERGREVREFLQKALGEEGLKRSVVVVATSNEPALLRLKASFLATRIAEDFRDQGEDVLFLMDSITRLAFAQREVGLSSGEPPATKGYPPSVYALLPRLLERTGTSERGSITGIYTILVEADDMGDPIADQVRSILDGHIVLSRDMAAAAQYPAVDILQSLSRSMPDIVSPDRLALAESVRRTVALCREVEDLVLVGAYQRGTSAEVDAALDLLPKLQDFFKQDQNESSPLEQTLSQLEALLSSAEASPSSPKAPEKRA